MRHIFFVNLVEFFATADFSLASQDFRKAAGFTAYFGVFRRVGDTHPTKRTESSSMISMRLTIYLIHSASRRWTTASSSISITAGCGCHGN